MKMFPAALRKRVKDGKQVLYLYVDQKATANKLVLGGIVFAVDEPLAKVLCTAAGVDVTGGRENRGKERKEKRG
jgi:hypothetical protein